MSGERDVGAAEQKERWPIGRSIVGRIRASVNDAMGPFVAADEERDVFSMLYLTERDACIPEELLDEELLDGIHAMYCAVLDGVRDELRERTGTRDSMLIIIDPSYEDTTAFALISDERVLVSGWRKAWHFYWESEDAMAEELEDWYRSAAQRLQPSPSGVERFAEDGRYMVTVQLERLIRVQADDPAQAREDAALWRDNEEDSDVQLVYEEIIDSRVEPATDEDE